MTTGRINQNATRVLRAPGDRQTAAWDASLPVGPLLTDDDLSAPWAVRGGKPAQRTRCVFFRRTTDSGPRLPNRTVRPAPAPRPRAAGGRGGPAGGERERALQGGKPTRTPTRPFPRAGRHPVRRARPSRDEPGVARSDTDGAGRSHRRSKGSRTDGRPSGRRQPARSFSTRRHRSHRTFYGPSDAGRPQTPCHCRGLPKRPVRFHPWTRRREALQPGGRDGGLSPQGATHTPTARSRLRPRTPSVR